MKSELVCLKDIAQFKNGKKRPNTKGNIPVYGGNGILHYADIANYENCIIVGRVGAYCGSIYYEPGKCWVSDNAIAVLPRLGTDVFYLYYLLKCLHLNERHIGTSQPLLTQEILNNISCAVVDESTQKKVSTVLQSLDRKISLNQKINDNLEFTIQLFFKRFFPSIFSASANCTIGDIITFSNGKKRPNSDGEIPVYGGNGILTYTDYANAENSVIIGRVGAFCGNTFLCDGKCWISDNAIQAKAKNTESQLFIYFLLKNSNLQQKHIGTSQPLLTQEILKSIPIHRPTSDSINEFIQICEPLYEKISINKKMNTRLGALRDSLLPKLMLGEIDISEIEL